MRAPLATVLGRLGEERIDHEVFEVGRGAVIVVSRHGGRVYGPFFDEGLSETWMPDAFGDAGEFSTLHASGEWNVGGDRLWIGPEIDFMIEDRSRYWDTYRMPAAIDPGAATLRRAAGVVSLYRHARLASHVAAPSRHASIDLGVRISRAEHPFRGVLLDDSPAGIEDVAFAGYTTEVTLSCTAPPEVGAESWLLAQVIAGGRALVPGSSRMRVTDYYEPVGDLLRPIAGGREVTMTGRDRFKIGFAAPHVTGRLGYLRDDGDESVLFIRVSPVTPGLDYAEEPDFAPGVRGDALHLYDDDGALGGFAEMECRGTPVSGDTERPVSDRFTTWWFRGDPAVLREICRHLLHLEPGEERTA